MKEARILHFFEFDMLNALRIVIELKNVKADDLKVRQDNQAPIVGHSSITPCMGSLDDPILPNASNRQPLNVEILRNGLNVL